MQQVFLSYAQEDRARAQALADALANHGWQVWWDRTIAPGHSWADMIEGAIRSAGAVIVLWSRNSIASDWVKKEAREGVRRGILVPARIEPVVPPFEFEHIQAADLSVWGDDEDHPELQSLVDRVSDLLGDGELTAAGATRSPGPSWSASARQWLGAKTKRHKWTAVSLVVVGVAVWLLTRPAPVVGSIAVEPATLSLGIGQKARLVATVRDTNGLPLTSRLAWSTRDSEIARVVPIEGQPAGAPLVEVEGLAKGRTVVRVRAPGEETLVPLLVRASTTSASTFELLKSEISISIDRRDLSPHGEALPWKAFDAQGEPVDGGVPLKWKSDNPRVVSVVDGILRGESLGVANVTARLGEVERSCRVNVVREIGQIKLAMAVPPIRVRLVLPDEYRGAEGLTASLGGNQIAIRDEAAPPNGGPPSFFALVEYEDRGGTFELSAENLPTIKRTLGGTPDDPIVNFR